MIMFFVIFFFFSHLNVEVLRPPTELSISWITREVDDSERGAYEQMAAFFLATIFFFIKDSFLWAEMMALALE